MIKFIKSITESKLILFCTTIQTIILIVTFFSSTNIMIFSNLLIFVILMIFIYKHKQLNDKLLIMLSDDINVIVDSLSAISAKLKDRIILAAGKMHAAGVLSEAAEKMAPGTVPGITMEYIKELVSYAHSLGALTITAIGTSQEGADVNTIRQIALMCKMTGTDIHHIGDTGYPGMALPESITAYSITIRGVRHTYHRMAASVNR